MTARYAAFVSSKRGPWIILALWLLIVGAAGPLGARFESAQSNEQRTFLPEGTDSLRVVELSKAFPSGEQAPAVIAYRRDSGLTAADREAMRRVSTAIAAAGIAGTRPPAPPVVSDDGRGAIVVVPIVVSGDSDVLVDAVQAIRDHAAEVPAGLEAKVGGGGGFSADAVKVFGNINSTLLIATASLVFVLLILIYRSPFFWIFPLLSVFAAETTVRAVGYLMTQAGVTVNGQSAGILLVLVFGAGTDYALLLVARYREELHRTADNRAAMRIALARSAPPILASCGTVVLGLLCLAFAQVNGTRGLGVTGAMGVAVAALAMLTLLPALLLVVGRRPFWPRVPRTDATTPDIATRGLFRRIGEWVVRRPRAVWVGVTVLLLALSAGLATYDDGLTATESFRGSVESVEAEALVGDLFPAGASAPAEIVVTDPARLDEVTGVLRASPLVAQVGPAESGPPGRKLNAIMTPEPYSTEGYAAIGTLRDDLARAGLGDVALVGGASAVERDLREASTRDTRVLPPVVLAVTFVVLVMLLRAIVASALIIVAVILSNLAAMGLSVLVFRYILGFAGVDPSFPLYAFIFLVALGVDYSIFLMARVREETETHGTREGTLRGLAATGSVITSAGIVLAGTFSVLMVLPLIALIEVGFVVAVGILIDTFIVRSVLMPAIVLDLGGRAWWPSSLHRQRGHDTGSGGTVP